MCAMPTRRGELVSWGEKQTGRTVESVDSIESSDGLRVNRRNLIVREKISECRKTVPHAYRSNLPGLITDVHISVVTRASSQEA